MRSTFISVFKTWSLAIAAAIVLTTGCKKDEDIEVTTEKFDAGVPTAWMSLAIDLTKKTAGFSPPVAARAYGYSGVALYESVVQGSKNYSSLQGKIQGLSAGTMPIAEKGKEYHWGHVANTALKTVFSHLYRTAPAAYFSKIDSLSEVFHGIALDEVSEEILERSESFGALIGTAVIEYSKGDGQDSCFKTNFPPSYIVPTGPGLWVPTPPAFQAIPLQPYWGAVRTFVADDVTASQPAPHPTYSEDPGSPFYLEAEAMYTAVVNLDAEQLVIAKFWSDDPVLTGTPPGHSISIASQVLGLENADLMLAAETFARVGMGVHDAFVSCWKCKYDYNLLRPVTFIHQFIDAAFTCPLNTPPFPEYTSGHSVQGGASAEILTNLFGDNYAFTDHTHEARTDIDGSPRSFDSFYDAADEAAISRLYGGIHYQAAITLGVEQGKKVGEEINALPDEKIGSYGLK